MVFILGTWYLYLRALRLRMGEVCCKRTCHCGELSLFLHVYSSHQYLARRLDALAETQEDDAPGEKQTQQQLPFHIPQVLYPLRLVQNIIPAKKKAIFFSIDPGHEKQTHQQLSSAVRLCSSVSFLQQDSKSWAILENREFKKWKFSFFRQRHALSTSFDILVVTYRVTNFLPKTLQHAIIFYRKNWISIFGFPIF